LTPVTTITAKPFVPAGAAGAKPCDDGQRIGAVGRTFLRNAPSTPKDLVCYKCGEKGHFVKECKDPSPAKGGYMRAAHIAMPDDADDKGEEEEELEEETEAPPEDKVEEVNDDNCFIVNYGAMAAMKTAGFVGETYVDIANFDRYDCILGTPFMHQNKVVLDFDKKCVVVNGVTIPAMAVEIGDNDSRLRWSRTVKKKGHAAN
ncbi:hypothetical protein H0H92_006846, partial [Tricholoma furcatifolium]